MYTLALCIISWWTIQPFKWILPCPYLGRVLCSTGLISHLGRIGLYCSDVAGAFDRVGSERPLNELSSLNLHESIFRVLRSWLERRTAYVIVNNKRSRHFCLKDMVFQGTVLGPPLWNLFFASCRLAVNKHLFDEVVFADDLNCYRKYHFDASDRRINKDLKSCQSDVHDWGRAHQVEFELSKESLHILCRKHPRGDAFKILGIRFDTKLVMYEAVISIVAEAGLG